MTPEEQRLIVELLPTARRAAGAMCRRLPIHEHDDAYGAALEALCRAVRRFDPSRGVSIDRYVVHVCTKAIIDELRRHNPISRSARHVRIEYRDATDHLIAVDPLHVPTHAEVLAELGVVDERRRRFVNKAMGGHIVPWDELPQDQPSDMDVAVEVTDGMALDQMRAAVCTALNERQQHVYRRVFVDELPYRVVAAELGVSEKRVSQMKTEITIALRRAMTEVAA